MLFQDAFFPQPRTSGSFSRPESLDFSLPSPLASPELDIAQVLITRYIKLTEGLLIKGLDLASEWGGPSSAALGPNVHIPASTRLDDNPQVKNISSQVHWGLREACPRRSHLGVLPQGPLPALSHPQLIKGHIPSV